MQLESAIRALDGPGAESTSTPVAQRNANGRSGSGMEQTPLFAPPSETVLEVAVCYDEEYGPDLPEIAAFAHTTIDQVIALHSGTTYRVYVIGFMPGFAYMASVDPRIALPRRSTPRTRVPAGSVAIAAGQTGIYPGDTPGGWHLIGRTRAMVYDPQRPQPFLFEPGDRVRFRPIERAEFGRA
jgi:inhibitor of KinA